MATNIDYIQDGDYLIPNLYSPVFGCQMCDFILPMLCFVLDWIEINVFHAQCPEHSLETP